MWQRIQSLYLGLAIILNLLIHVFSIATIEASGQHYEFTLWGLLSAETSEILYSSYPLLGLNLISVLLSLVIIFMFKKRQLQIKLSQLNLFIQMGFVAALFFLVDAAIESLNLTDSAVNYELGAFISLVPLLFIYLAIRSIKKDEALVRAADRIR